MYQIDIEAFGKKVVEYSEGGVLPVICFFGGSHMDIASQRVELNRGWERLKCELLKSKIVTGGKPSGVRKDCNGVFPRVVRLTLSHDHFRLDPVWPMSEAPQPPPVILDINSCISAAEAASA